MKDDFKYYLYVKKPKFSQWEFPSSYSLVMEVSPRGKWTLKIQKQFKYGKRLIFNGSLEFTGADYDYLNAMAQDRELNPHVLLIQKRCDGVWEDYWKGFVSFSDFTDYDIDRKFIAINPKVFDDYSLIMNNFSLEKNILETEDMYEVVGTRYQYQIESIDDEGDWGFPSAPTYSAHPTEPSGTFYLFQRDCKYYSGFNEWWIVDTYMREIDYTDDSGTPPPGTNWVYIEEVEAGLHKWARPIGNSLVTTYTHNTNGQDEWWTLDISGAYTFDHNNCRLLKDVIEFLIRETGLTYTSQLLNNATNPISGLTDDSLQYLFIQQASDLRYAQQEATIGKTSLQDVMKWLEGTFDAHWIVRDGIFYIEHESYFENGGDYSSEQIAIDLTQSIYDDYTLNMNKFSFLKEKIPRYESWEFDYSEGVDFKGKDIDYPNLVGFENGVESRRVNVAVDLPWIYNNLSDVSNKGFLLLHAFELGGTYYIQNALGKLTNQSQQNGYLSLANLHDVYWRNGRPLPKGNLNGAYTTFNSSKRIQRMDEISFPYCCDDDFDFHELVEVEEGVGEIESGEINPFNGRLTLNIII